ncbi:MAG: acyltransferase [Sphingomonadales bacterium]|nr:MAG: acyltransferase [Sphingomonadales bacterium]
MADRPAMRFDVLDALRGICAVLVVLYHFSSNGYIARLPIVQNGWLFVDYFFVLSGFVITHSYGARLGNGEITVGRFMGLRFGRIYPLHLFVLLGFVALEMLLVFGGDTIARYVSRAPFSGSRGLEPLFQNLFLLQTFGVGNGTGWNVPAWSIAAEIWTYLLFAPVFVFAKGRILLASIGLAGGAALVLIATRPDLHVTFAGGFVRCIFGFGVGVVTYHAFLRLRPAGGSIQELGALVVTMGFVSMASGPLTFLAPLVFAGMILALASQNGVVSRCLHARPFQFLGLISYSIYMIHMFVQGRLGEVLQITGLVEIEVDPDGRTLLVGVPIAADAITLIMLGLVVAGAYVTYHLVEVPGQKLARQLLAPPRPADPTEASQP